MYGWSRMVFACKIIIIIIDHFSPRGEQGHWSFSSVTLSLAATSACLQVLNLRCSLSLFTVLHHVSLDCPLLGLPSGAHVSTILGFLSDGILKIWPNHFQKSQLQNTVDCIYLWMHSCKTCFHVTSNVWVSDVKLWSFPVQMWSVEFETAS